MATSKRVTAYGYKVRDDKGGLGMLYFSKPQKIDSLNETDLVDIDPKLYVKDNDASDKAGCWVAYERLSMTKDERKPLYAANRKFSFIVKLNEVLKEGNVLVSRARGAALSEAEATEVLDTIAGIHGALKANLVAPPKSDPAAVSSSKVGRFAHLFGR